jgi:hypothetical protein
VLEFIEMSAVHPLWRIERGKSWGGWIFNRREGKEKKQKANL